MTPHTIIMQVRHVVAIDGREPVLDTASKLFARVLYDALFRYTYVHM